MLVYIRKNIQKCKPKKKIIIKPKLFSFTHILRRGRKKTKGEVVDIQNIQKKKRIKIRKIVSQKMNIITSERYKKKEAGHE